jgi:hypothetical protein
MLSFFANIPADTWTLLVGLVVFAALRYFVRRQVKSALNTPTTTKHSKFADTNHAKTTPKAVEEVKKCGKTACCQSSHGASCADSSKDDGPLVILYGTTTGTARKLSSQLADKLGEKCTVRDCADFGKNIDEEFAAYVKSRARLVSQTCSLYLI